MMDSHELVIPFQAALNHLRHLVTNTESFEALGDAAGEIFRVPANKLENSTFGNALLEHN